MTTVTKRIARLENRAGIGEGQRSYLVIMCNAGSELDHGKCIGILRRFGFLPESHSGVRVADFGNVPDDLNADELERLLRQKGEEICGPRSAFNQPGPAHSGGKNVHVSIGEY
jgi:hypothetical protein